MGRAARSWVKGIEVVNGLKYLVKAADKGAEVKTEGGIIIPGTAKEDWSKYGRVYAEGDGAYVDGEFRGCKYTVGDYLYFDRYTGKVVVDGVEYRQVDEAFVVAKADAAALGLDSMPVLLRADERAALEAAE